MRVGGTAGLSLGVMHQGNQVYFANYGYRDVERGLAPDETIFPVSSLTMAVTAAALGILVNEGKATWETLIKDALPSLNLKDEIFIWHFDGKQDDTILYGRVQSGPGRER